MNKILNIFFFIYKNPKKQIKKFIILSWKFCNKIFKIEQIGNNRKIIQVK